MRAERDIYDPTFVKGVFDRSASASRNKSRIASFGFAWLSRRKCVKQLPLPSTATPVIADLMAGTGETWSYILKRHRFLRKIHAIDISTSKVETAIERLQDMQNNRIEIYQRDILDEKLAIEPVDAVICTFGLKTFNHDQQDVIARKVAAMLKPGGVLSFIEASEPRIWGFSQIYMGYLRAVLPAIDRLILSGSQDYAMMGTYTQKFANCQHFAECLKKYGIDVGYKSHYFGCATGVTGRKRTGAL